MDKIENIDDIRSLIALGIEECTTLEYKSGIDTSNNRDTCKLPWHNVT